MMTTLLLLVVASSPGRGRSVVLPPWLAVFLLLQSLWFRLDFAAGELSARLAAGIRRAPFALRLSLDLGFSPAPPIRLVPVTPRRSAADVPRRLGGQI